MTEKSIVIHAQTRSEVGKTAARRLRQQGTIPGVLYHKGKAVQLAISAANLPKEHTRAQVVKLVLDQAEKTVVMREVQVDPLTEKPLHFDFQEVSPEDKITISVPIKYVGLTREQEKEGSFSIHTRYLLIKTKVAKLPTVIEIDVSHLKVTQSVFLRDVKVAPEVMIRTAKGKNIALASIAKIAT